MSTIIRYKLENIKKEKINGIGANIYEVEFDRIL